MIPENERAKILEMIDDGIITAEQGLSLLNALGESYKSGHDSSQDEIESYLDEAMPTQLKGMPENKGDLESFTRKKISSSFLSSLAEDSSQNEYPEVDESGPYQVPESFEGEVEVMTPETPDTEEMIKWKRWWVIPFWIGAGITVIGGALMYWAYNASGFGFWFACAWFPFLLGVSILALGWGSRTTPWLHVRVHQAPGETPQKIAISFPIPIRLTAWGLRTFGHHIPHMEGISLDEVILALKDVTKNGVPFFIDVNEGEDGEHVQVFIG